MRLHRWRAIAALGSVVVLASCGLVLDTAAPSTTTTAQPAAVGGPTTTTTIPAPASGPGLCGASICAGPLVPSTIPCGLAVCPPALSSDPLNPGVGSTTTTTAPQVVLEPADGSYCTALARSVEEGLAMAQMVNEPSVDRLKAQILRVRSALLALSSAANDDQLRQAVARVTDEADLDAYGEGSARALVDFFLPLTIPVSDALKNLAQARPCEPAAG